MPSPSVGRRLATGFDTARRQRELAPPTSAGKLGASLNNSMAGIMAVVA